MSSPLNYGFLHIQMVRAVMLIAVDLYLLFHISQRLIWLLATSVAVRAAGEPFKCSLASHKFPPWLPDTHPGCSSRKVSSAFLSVG